MTPTHVVEFAGPREPGDIRPENACIARVDNGDLLVEFHYRPDPRDPQGDDRSHALIPAEGAEAFGRAICELAAEGAST